MGIYKGPDICSAIHLCYWKERYKEDSYLIILNLKITIIILHFLHELPSSMSKIIFDPVVPDKHLEKEKKKKKEMQV